MALNKSEPKYAGEFLASQASGQRSLDTVTLLTGTVYQPGDVLGVITATGKATLVDTTAFDGRETAAKINYAYQDASGGDVAGAPVVARDAEVNSAELNFNSVDATIIANIKADLATVGIICRTGL